MIEYRKATMEDLDELVRMRLQFMKEVQHIVYTERDSAMRASMTDYFRETMPNEHFVAHLALEDGKVIGTSGMCFFRRPPSFKNLNGTVAYIMNMFTLPTHRGLGIAATLFQRLLDEARERGHLHVTLNATEMGRPLYEKFGFKLTGDEMSLTLQASGHECSFVLDKIMEP